MIDLVGLPKNGHIRLEWGNLIVKNHRVVNPNSILEWIMIANSHGMWEFIIPRMLQQGFRFEAVREKCIADLRDLFKSSRVFYWYDDGPRDCEERERFLKTVEGKKLRGEFSKKIGTCENWEQLENLLRHGQEFHQYMKNKMLERYLP